jgi:RimJ/RimL family protein N-acetyltransferase
MDDVIRTERLVLRRATMNDVAAFHAIFSDPEAMRYWSSLPHERVEQTRQWVDSMVNLDRAKSDDFVITLDGAAIGKMGAYRLPDFGFIVAREHWGKGLATEALKAFLAHRRGVDPGGRLTADVDPQNDRSLGLLKRHGFVETGRKSRTWQIGENWCDSVYLALDL